MTIILKSKPIVEQRKVELALEVEQLKRLGTIPSLKVLLVGDYAPSLIYTKNKKKYLESIGAECEIIKLPKDTEYNEIEKKIKELNSDDSVHGILVQLPLPDQINNRSEELIDQISQNKDIDGLAKANQLALFRGEDFSKYHLPCTPKGILTLLEFNNIELSGKDVVIIGRGQLVGRPLAALMTKKNATVTVCHSKTDVLRKHTENADIIILAAGACGLISKEDLGKNKPYIIDVGMNKNPETGKLIGDCDYKSLINHCHSITPVPGGVGPMTILSLAENLLNATKRNIDGIKKN